MCAYAVVVVVMVVVVVVFVVILVVIVIVLFVFVVIFVVVAVDASVRPRIAGYSQTYVRTRYSRPHIRILVAVLYPVVVY